MNTLVIARLCDSQVVIAQFEQRIPPGFDPSTLPEGETTPAIPVLVKPMSIYTTPPSRDNPRMQVTLVPYGNLFGLLPPVEEFVLYDHLVMCPLAEAPKPLADEYIKAVSGIAVMPANSHLSLIK